MQCPLLGYPSESMNHARYLGPINEKSSGSWLATQSPKGIAAAGMQTIIRIANHTTPPSQSMLDSADMFAMR